jgi:hypothetical protein
MSTSRAIPSALSRQRRPRRSRSTAISWLALLMLCLGVFHARQTTRAWAATDLADFRNGRGRFADMSPDVGRAIRDELRPLVGQTVDDAEARLGRHRGPEVNVPARGRFIYFVPGSAVGPWAARWEVVLRFHDGRVVAAYAAVKNQTYPGAPWLCAFAEMLSVGLMALGPLVWVTGLLAFYAQPDARPRFAQVMLAGIVITALGWFTVPDQVSLVLPAAPLIAKVVALLFTASLLDVVRRLLPLRSLSVAGRHCLTCRYDLTGNISGVCPECGTPTPQSRRRRRDDEVEELVKALSG